MLLSARATYVAILLVAILANAGVAAWVYRRADGRAADFFVLSIVFGVTHGTLGVVQTLVRDLSTMKLVAAAKFFPLWASVLAITGFVVHYVGRESLLTRRRWAGLIGVAAVGSGLEATNPLHGLLFRNVEPVEEPFRHLTAEPTPLYWVVGGAGYLIVLGSVALLARSLLASRRVNRRQALLLSLGIVPSVVVGVGQTADYIPANGLNYMPVAAAGFAAVVGYTLFREQLFAVNPVSRAAVMESVTDAVVVLDAKRRLVDFNAAAAPLGVDEDDIGSDVGSVLPGVLRSGEPTADGGTGRVETPLDPALATEDRPLDDSATDTDTETESEFADRFVDRSGAERRQYVVQPSAVGDPERPRGFVVVLRDVTAVETYAAELERQTDRLDRFASTVSHDLRNPLSVARGYVETAVDTDDPEHLPAAIEALDRADEIIEQSLTLAREGRAIDSPDPVSLTTVARDAWATADTGDATLAVETERTLPADRDRLAALLENLFRNAVEHGDADRVHVRDHPDGFVVADDGSGVDPTVRERAFERGYSSGQGTGLGLAIVESIATAHGWSVTLEESETGGARFSFTGVGTDRHDAGETVEDPAAPGETGD